MNLFAIHPSIFEIDLPSEFRGRVKINLRHKYIFLSLPSTEEEHETILNMTNDRQLTFKFTPQYNSNGLRVSLTMGKEGLHLDLTNSKKFRQNSLASFIPGGIALRVSISLDFGMIVSVAHVCIRLQVP